MPVRELSQLVQGSPNNALLPCLPGGSAFKFWNCKPCFVVEGLVGFEAAETMCARAMWIIVFNKLQVQQLKQRNFCRAVPIEATFVEHGML